MQEHLLQYVRMKRFIKDVNSVVLSDSNEAYIHCNWAENLNTTWQVAFAIVIFEDAPRNLVCLLQPDTGVPPGSACCSPANSGVLCCP